MRCNRSAVFTASRWRSPPGAPMRRISSRFPRNRTLISQGWDFYNQVPSPTSMSPYAGLLLHQRNSLHYTVNEMLFYTNHMSNEITPWQAESFSYNDAFTEMTVKIRDKVKWSDGQPFTADDVVFTLDMLKSVAPDLLAVVRHQGMGGKGGGARSANGEDHAHEARPALGTGLPRSGTGGSLRRRAEAHLDRPGSEDLQLLRSPEGLAGRNRPLQARRRATSGTIVFDRRDTWWAFDAGVAPGDAGRRTRDLQARDGRRRAAALHQQRDRYRPRPPGRSLRGRAKPAIRA